MAFVADNPGDWMFHCHIIEHQESGMMGYVQGDMRIVAAALLALSAPVAATGAAASGELDAALGKALFERDWVPAPASTDAAERARPALRGAKLRRLPCRPSARARASPMRRTGGRGARLRACASATRRADPDPLYGHLLQGQAVPGMLPEGPHRALASADPAKGYTSTWS